MNSIATLGAPISPSPSPVVTPQSRRVLGVCDGSVAFSVDVSSMPSRHANFWDKLSRGDWDPCLLAYLRDAIPGEHSVADIGAWIGPTTLYMASLKRGDQFECHAVEPDPVAREILGRNVCLNDTLFGFGIKVHPEAISRNAEKRQMGSFGEGGFGNSTTSFMASTAQGGQTVRCMTYADLLGRMSTPPGLVKLDVEGGEGEVMESMIASGETPKKLIIEIHPDFLPSQDAGDQLQDTLCSTWSEALLIPRQAGSIEPIRLTDIRRLIERGDTFQIVMSR